MIAQQLLSALGQACSLPDLSFNEEHCARLLLDGTLSVQFEYDVADEVIHIYSPLGPIPAHGREQLYQEMLEDNLFGHTTSGAILSLDKLHGDVLLWRSVPILNTTSEAMVSITEEFVTVAEHWSNKLGNAGAPNTSSTAPRSRNLSTHGSLRV